MNTPERRKPNTVEHVHRRDGRPCPALYPPPLRPTKPAAIWLFRWAVAIQHLETLETFRAEYPDDVESWTSP